MAIACTEASQSFMVDSRFKTTAFICFFTAIMEIPSLILFLFHMVAAIKLSLNLMIFVRLPLAIVASVFSIYILLQLERLLVERYNLQNIRIMIKSLIIMCCISIAADIFFTLSSNFGGRCVKLFSAVILHSPFRNLFLSIDIMVKLI